jgi:hypothetical protein
MLGKLGNKLQGKCKVELTRLEEIILICLVNICNVELYQVSSDEMEKIRQEC